MQCYHPNPTPVQTFLHSIFVNSLAIFARSFVIFHNQTLVITARSITTALQCVFHFLFLNVFAYTQDGCPF